MVGAGLKRGSWRASGRSGRFSESERGYFAGEVELGLELAEVEEGGHPLVLLEEVGSVLDICMAAGVLLRWMDCSSDLKW